MAWKAEVQVGGDANYYTNSLAFATEAEALAYGHDLAYRWMAVRDMRIVNTDEQPNYRWTAAGAQLLPEREDEP